MNVDELRIWLKSEGQSRKELAQKLGISNRTVESWFTKKSIPKAHQLALEYMMRESLDKISFSLTAAEMSKLLKKMTAAGYTDLKEYITHLIRKELGGK